MVQYLSENEDKKTLFYTPEQSTAVNAGIISAVAAINITIMILGIMLLWQIWVPFVGWVLAAVTILAIATATVSQIVLLGQLVKPYDPITIEAGNLKKCAIQTEINGYQKQIDAMNLAFDTLKYEFKGNQSYIKPEAKKILKYLDDIIELIHDMYFLYLNDPTMAIIQFYKQCVEARINLLIISNDHTLRKDLDIKSSDIDITKLDDQSIKYYTSIINKKDGAVEPKKKELDCNTSSEGPPPKGDIKSDITNYLIIVTKNVGNHVSAIKCYVDKQVENYQESRKKRKHSISENNLKKLASLFKKLKPILDKINEHISKMKNTISAGAKLFEIRSQLESMIAEDKKLIEAVNADMIKRFFTQPPKVKK